jgi:hypothetical protein
MQEINSKFKSIRVNLRKEGADICEDVFRRFHPSTITAKKEICVFCNSTSQLTKEHVLPRWVFQKSTSSEFISSVNQQSQTYNKSVIPTCSECNNSILGFIEKHMIKVVERLESCDSYDENDLFDSIRWLELIDYKAQVFDCRRKYIKYGKSEYDMDWGIFPVAIMRHFVDMNPFKAHKYIRSAQLRITVKNKSKRLNSLVIFDTSHSHLNFFTKPNEYTFVSFPTCKIALFYFLRKNFNLLKDAEKEALYIISMVAKT